MDVDDNPWSLTKGEIAAMMAYSDAGTVKGAAAKLRVSVKTVESHLFRARNRMGGLQLVPACIWMDRWVREEQIEFKHTPLVARDTREQEVMSLVRKHGVLTRSMLAQELEISTRVAGWHLAQLGRKGLIVKVNTRRGRLFTWGWKEKTQELPVQKPTSKRVINSVFALGM